jgi:ketosteroid isomerase-like protein
MKRAILAALFCVAASAAAAADDPSAIARTVGEKFASACDAGDVNTVLALYRDDARVVYPGAGQSAANKAELRHIVAQTCAKGGPKFELVGYRAIWVDATHTVIAALGDWNATGPGPDGKPMTTPLRATEVIMKTSSGWQYVVDHASFGVPAPAADAKP